MTAPRTRPMSEPLTHEQRQRCAKWFPVAMRMVKRRFLAFPHLRDQMSAVPAVAAEAAMAAAQCWCPSRQADGKHILYLWRAVNSAMRNHRNFHRSVIRGWQTKDVPIDAPLPGSMEEDGGDTYAVMIPDPIQTEDIFLAHDTLERMAPPVLRQLQGIGRAGSDVKALAKLELWFDWVSGAKLSDIGGEHGLTRAAISSTKRQVDKAVAHWREQSEQEAA